MTKPNSVRSKLHNEITTFMKNNNKWFEYLMNELPSSWENYNGFIVFSFPSFMSHIWLEAGNHNFLFMYSCQTLLDSCRFRPLGQV